MHFPSPFIQSILSKDPESQDPAGMGHPSSGILYKGNRQEFRYRHQMKSCMVPGYPVANPVRDDYNPIITW
jgi:hypothetical protein